MPHQLISDAIRHGDTHKPTMEMADYYIKEKQYVHKLFKVLAPRFENCPVSYTRMYKAPQRYPGQPRKMAILELRGNPYPPLKPDLTVNRNFIQNVLLDAAKKEYRRKKYEELANAITANDDSESSPNVEKVAEKLKKVSFETETAESRQKSDDSTKVEKS